MIFVTDERSSELSLRGKARDKLSTVQFPAHDRALDQADARAGDQALHLWVSRRKNLNAGLAQNVAQSGCLMGLGQTEERGNGNSDRDGAHWRYPASFRRD
jgi:hypothetical protein